MIFLLIGRGIEGCGVTKFSLELDKYLEKRGIPHQSYAFNDKKWTRRKSHDINDIMQVALEDDEQFNNFINVMRDNATTVVINSLPSESHSELFQSRFKELLSFKDKKYILFQHDHARMSIQRNACLDEAIQASTICYAHSRNNYFAKYVEEKFNSSNLESFFSDVEQKHIEVLPFQPAFDFDECRKEYWKDISEQDPRHHKWIGRTTFWKGFELMFDWHDRLRECQAVTTFEGIETGIVYPEFIIRKPHHNFCKGFTEATRKIFEKKGLSNEYIDAYGWHGPKDIADYDVTQHYGDKALVFGIYKNHELLHRLSRCGFGYQLTMLDPKNIERSIEYTHCEVVAAGAIPVFRKKFGQACTHRSIGKPLYECENTGTIWLDEDNFDECIEQVKTLTHDDGMRNEWREMAYEFYKDHQDTDNVFKNIVENFV